MTTTRLKTGPFYADIVRDRRDPSLWIYVVQRVDSSDIVAMGTCTSEQQCREVARKAMADLRKSTAAAS